MRASHVVVFLLLCSCLNPRTFGGRFDHVGEITSSADAAARTIVPNAEAVRVFYETAPAGFSLKDNELRVEAGYEHQVLGVVRVVPRTGNCVDGGSIAKPEVIRLLRETAYQHGANAVIYAMSVPDEQPRCTLDQVGSGWAVVLREAKPSVPPPASTPEQTGNVSTPSGP
jgi:hypothetical protein